MKRYQATVEQTRSTYVEFSEDDVVLDDKRTAAIDAAFEQGDWDIMDERVTIVGEYDE